MADLDASDDSSIIDIDDAPSSAPPPKYQHRRLKPPSARAILEQGDRDFRKPPNKQVKCHILGVAVLHDLLKHFERRQGQPLAREARQQVEKIFNSAKNFVLSDLKSNQAYYRSEKALRSYLRAQPGAQDNMGIFKQRGYAIVAIKKRLAPLFRVLDTAQGLPESLGSRLELILGQCMPPKGALELEGAGNRP